MRIQIFLKRMLPLWAALLVNSSALLAQQPEMSFEYYQIPYSQDWGVHSNEGDKEIVAYTKVLFFQDVLLMRVHFGEYHLGARSYVVLTSLQDQQSQRLDAVSMVEWNQTTAIFNGNTVKVELHVAPGESDAFVKVDQLIDYSSDVHPIVSGPSLAGPTLQSLCGTDGRGASTDNRVGRINGCTGWLVSNGAVLAAGHCGNVSGVFSVNVPLSASDGTAVASAVIDQFPVIANSSVRNNNGLGDDWNVFSIGRNSAGESAHVKFGFFRMTRTIPALTTTLRITGFGVDNTPAGTGNACCNTDSSGNCTHRSCNTRNRTLQTATGTLTSHDATGPTFSCSYQVDTEPANSGSPIIWESNGFAIGIHTNGGCPNDGTTFENAALGTALHNFIGNAARYVDTVTYPGSPASTGNIFAPYHTLPTAVSSLPNGGQISLVEGSYTKANSNTGTFGADGRAFTFIAPVGTVTIGN